MLAQEPIVMHGPDVQGDYVGIEGLKNFFKPLAGKTNGTFKIEVVSARPIGEELVVVHIRDTMELEDDTITVDAVVVWRIVSGHFAKSMGHSVSIYGSDMMRVNSTQAWAVVDE